jgi:hypothetical protein
MLPLLHSLCKLSSCLPAYTPIFSIWWTACAALALPRTAAVAVEAVEEVVEEQIKRLPILELGAWRFGAVTSLKVFLSKTLSKLFERESFRGWG